MEQIKKRREITLPAYTRKEELFNMYSHIAGIFFGVFALVYCVALSVIRGNVIGIVASVIYGASIIMLFTVSSLYHGLKDEKIKRTFRVIDHCTIYLMIAGNYTPFALCAIGKTSLKVAWIALACTWGISIFAMVLTAIDMNRFRKFSTICYLGIGGSAIFAAKYIYAALSLWGFLLMVLGGVMYYVGFVFYALGKKKRYFHFIFHLFVLAGSLIHFFCIIFYVL